MLSAAFMSWWGWIGLFFRLLVAVPAAGIRHVPKRLLLFTVGWLLFGMLNLMHWIGFLLDEVLFRGYRHTAIHKPLFILGVPRSGTTHLQRVLADEEALTSLTLIEAVIAPSISERYLWFGVGRLLQRVFRQVEWRWLTDRLSVMDDIHRIRLDEPEEDFLLLLWIQACFLLVVPCPNSQRYWDLAYFDERLPPASRRATLGFYRRCVQKHLYYHGTHLRLLSKNPSFTPMLASLRQAFPDGVFVACIREPEKTVPSQLSSLLPAFELLAGGAVPNRFQFGMIAVLHHYYALIGQQAETLLVVPMKSITDDLAETIRKIRTAADLNQQAVKLQPGDHSRPDSQSQHQSQHRYALEDFDLDKVTIDKRFGDVWDSSGEVAR